MRPVTLSLLFLLLAGCLTVPVADKAPLTERHWAGGASWDAAMVREEQDFLKLPQARARRGAAGLELQLRSGAWHAVPENHRCAGDGGDVLRDCVRKYALQRDTVLQHWLLAVRLYRGEAFALVDEADGSETLLIGLPHRSPDGQAVVAVNAAATGDTVNGIEVWQRDSQGLHLVFFHPAGDTERYRFVDWVTGSLARLTVQACPDRAACQPPREAVLARRGAGWQLIRPAS